MKNTSLVLTLLLINSCKPNFWQHWRQDSKQKITALMTRLLSERDSDLQGALDSILQQRQRNGRKKKVEPPEDKRIKTRNIVRNVLRTS